MFNICTENFRILGVSVSIETSQYPKIITICKLPELFQEPRIGKPQPAGIITMVEKEGAPT